MSSSEHSKPESKRSVYDTCDPAYLRQLREDAGMDLIVLARTACLSVAKVRQLESHDSDHLFYSDAIKRQAYKRLLMILGMGGSGKSYIIQGWSALCFSWSRPNSMTTFAATGVAAINVDGDTIQSLIFSYTMNGMTKSLRTKWAPLRCLVLDEIS